MFKACRFFFLFVTLLSGVNCVKAQEFEPQRFLPRNTLLYLEVADARRVVVDAGEAYFHNFYGPSYADKKLKPLNIPLASTLEDIGTKDELHWLKEAFDVSYKHPQLARIQSSIARLTDEGVTLERRIAETLEAIGDLFSGKMFLAVEPSDTNVFRLTFGFQFDANVFDWNQYLASISDKQYSAQKNGLYFLKNEGVYCFVHESILIGCADSSDERSLALLDMLQRDEALSEKGLEDSRQYRRSMLGLKAEEADVVCFARPDALLDIVKEDFGITKSNHRNYLEGFKDWSSGFGLVLNFNGERTFDYTVRQPILEPLAPFLIELDKHLVDLDVKRTRRFPKLANLISFFKPAPSEKYSNQALLYIPGYRLDLARWSKSFGFQARTFVSNTIFHRSPNLMASVESVPVEVTRFLFAKQEKPTDYFKGYQPTDGIHGQFIDAEDINASFEDLVAKLTESVNEESEVLESLAKRPNDSKKIADSKIPPGKTAAGFLSAEVKLNNSNLFTATTNKLGFTIVNQQGGTTPTETAIRDEEAIVDEKADTLMTGNHPFLSDLPSVGVKVIYLRRNFSPNEIYWERIRPISIFVATCNQRNVCSPDYTAKSPGDYVSVSDDNLCFDRNTSLISRLSLPLLTLLDRELMPTKNLRLIRLKNSDFAWVEVLVLNLDEKSIGYRGGIFRNPSR